MIASTSDGRPYVTLTVLVISISETEKNGVQQFLTSVRLQTRLSVPFGIGTKLLNCLNKVMRILNLVKRLKVSGEHNYLPNNKRVRL